MNNVKERVIFRGGPSQMVNYNTFFTSILLLIAISFAPKAWDLFFAASFPQYKSYYMLASKILFFLPAFIVIRAWLTIHCHKYTITTERLKEEEGILSKTTDELELFRVKDITFVQPFSLRVFGCGNIVLDTSDKSTPIVVLYALKNAQPVLEALRKNVQHMRTKKGVREIDS